MQSQLAIEYESIQFIPPHPSTGQRNQFQFRGAIQALPATQIARGARVWVEVRDRSELRSGSVVDLRVVDILVVDVRLDMDELTNIGLLVIGTLAGLSYPTRPWIWA